MKKNITSIIILSLIIFSIHFSDAQPGTLDAIFGTAGKVTTPVENDNDESFAIAIQPDGKIVVAGKAVNSSGNNDFALARYNTNGTLDTSFSNDGKVTLSFTANSDCYVKGVVIQPDGKIVIGGYYENLVNSFYYFAVLRFNANGTPDNTFGASGKVGLAIGTGNDAEANSVALQPDGKIVVAGKAYNLNNDDIALARFDTNGTVDNTFGTGGKVITPIGALSDDIGNAVALQTDGKILVGGISYFNTINHFLIVRYNTNGTLDTTFNSTGVTTLVAASTGNTGHSLAVQTDGKILLAGAAANGSAYDFSILRVTTTGIADVTFNATGIVNTDFTNSFDEATGIDLQSDGKIVVGGYIYDGSNDLFALLRYKTDGTIDSTFGTNGKVVTSFNANGADFINALKLQANGKIVATGYTDNGINNDFALARYNNGISLGMVDFSFGSIAPILFPNPVKNEAVLKYTLIIDEKLTLTLHDVSGKLIKTFFTDQKKNSGENRETLNFDKSITPGNYILVMKNNSSRKSIKIIKQ
ncbi:MAG: T9SS type A sorting domain-containing protein [Bacteroidia bacterium]